MQLLGDVETKRQTREFDRAGNTEHVRERDRPHPFDLRLAGFGARNIDGDARPRAATVADGKLRVDRAILKPQRLSLPSECESLVGVARQRAFERSREIGVRMLQHDIDVFRGARAIA